MKTGKCTHTFDNSGEKLSGLSKIAEILALGSDLKNTQTLILENVINLTEGDIGYIYLFDDKEVLHLSVVSRKTPSVSSFLAERVIFSDISHMPLYQIIESKKGLLLKDITNDIELVNMILPYVGAVEYVTWICAPLYIGNINIGAISIAARETGNLAEDDLEFLEIVGNLYNIYLTNEFKSNRQCSESSIEATGAAEDAQRKLSGNIQADIDSSVLSKREYEVLRYIAKGYTCKQIANLLYLSTRTVETYRNCIMIKLDFSQRSELVEYALLHKII